MTTPAAADPPALAAVRRLLLLALFAGMAGTLTELLLLGHFESAWQITPLVLLAAGLLVVVWLARSASAPAVRALQLMMALFVAGGMIGVGLHYTGNAEFELEMYPTLGGLALVGGALTGATPVLAPGSMILLGLVGLACSHRHPGLFAEPDTAVTPEEHP